MISYKCFDNSSTHGLGKMTFLFTPLKGHLCAAADSPGAIAITTITLFPAKKRVEIDANAEQGGSPLSHPFPAEQHP
jgi:hypothetical protein